MSGRITYREAIKQNGNRPTCLTCFRPMRYANPQICDSCYGDLSKSGNLLERKETCNLAQTSKL